MTLFLPCSLVRTPRTSFGATEMAVEGSALPYAMAGTLPERRRRFTSPLPRAVRTSALSVGNVARDLVEGAAAAVIVSVSVEGKSRWKRGRGDLAEEPGTR